MSETTTYRQAIARAIADEIAGDDDVFVLGEDVGRAGGVFKTTEGLFERFGELRVRDTPISEQAIIGTAIGSALKGLRPVAEIMFADFAGVCFDQIANELAKYRYMTGGQVTLPVTVRLANGAGGGFGAQHSQAVENWFLNISGLKIVVPATPADAYRLLRASVRDPNPVLYFEHKGLLNLKGELPTDGFTELGGAEVVRRGDAATVVASQLMRHRTVDAARQLSTEGIEVELIDPRILVPFDTAAVTKSIERTNRLVVVQESPRGGSWGASVIAQISEEHFELLDAPPCLVGGDETPIPYARALEEAWLPSTERIAERIRRTLAW